MQALKFMKDSNMHTIKVLSYLLTYPDEPSRDILEEAIDIIRSDNGISPATKNGLFSFLHRRMEADHLDEQEDYVSLFDRTPSLSLHLFEHIHGDSKDRGQALVDLNNLYMNSGFFITTEEMPDYLPLFLEFISSIPIKEGISHLSAAAEVIAAIAARLQKRKSDYAFIFNALLEKMPHLIDEVTVQRALSQNDGHPLDHTDIDTAWNEQFAFEANMAEAGIPQPCPIAQQMVQRMTDAPARSTSVEEI